MEGRKRKEEKKKGNNSDNYMHSFSPPLNPPISPIIQRGSYRDTIWYLLKHTRLTHFTSTNHTRVRHTITKFRLLFLPFRWQFCCRHILRCEKLQYAFPICDDPSLIGYHINKMSFNKLGESNCLTQVRGREHVTWRDVTFGRSGEGGTFGRSGEGGTFGQSGEGGF